MGRRNCVSMFVLAMSVVAACQTSSSYRKLIRPAMPRTRMNEILPGSLLVKLRNAPSNGAGRAYPTEHQMSRFSAKIGGKFLSGLPHGGWTRWQIPSTMDPREAAKVLRGDPDVVYVQPENKVYAFTLPVPNDGDWSYIETASTYAFNAGTSSGSAGSSDFRRLWSLWDTNAVTADTGSLTGGWAVYPGTWFTSGTKPADCPIIAFIDTGLDMDHPDFINAGGTVTDISGGGQIMKTLSAYFENGVPVKGGDPTDENGHGTHVTGIAIAAGNNGSFNSEGMIGIGYNSRGMILRVFDSAGNASDANAAGAIYYAADNGAAIINLSLGTTNYSQVFQDAVTYAWQKGTLVVCAGNENGSGGGNLGPIYPAACSGALAVTANAPGLYPADDNYAGYGNYVCVAAPGGDLVTHSTTSYSLQYVWSTATRYANQLSQDTTVFPPYTLNYTYLVGTSMACPHVSGAAGLYYGQNKMHQTDGFANLKAFQAIENAALGTAGAAFGGWEPTQGYGSLDVQGLLNLSTQPNPRIATVGDVTGIVYFGGTPQTNVAVTATLVAAPHTVFQTTTFADGTYRFDAFPAGIYDITASPLGTTKTKRVQVSVGCDFPGLDFFCGPAVTDTTPPVVGKFNFVSGTNTSLDFDQWGYDTETEIDSVIARVGTVPGASNILRPTLILPGALRAHLTGFTGYNLPSKYFVQFTYTNGIGLVSHAVHAYETDYIDAYVQDSAPTTDVVNKQLTVSTGSSGSNQIAYLNVDLSKLSKNVVSASISLTGAANGAAVNVGAYGTDNSTWTQAGLTWNNKPKLVGAALSDQSVNKAGTYSWDISSLVKTAVAAGQKTLTIALKCDSTSSTGATFASQRSTSGFPHFMADTHD